MYIAKQFDLCESGRAASAVNLKFLSVPATWPNNDADARAPQGLNLEKVKNLYCTATMKKFMLTTWRADAVSI
ncbi:hypothetical protein [Bradyrhizobium sp.]|uniref:hypothetical protein n=1 Tax=Bradyrhizobium sp. TaxID=376 RepID=UPI00261C36CC|nr:hypothetical protein [Bradyrhizobium sp.]